MTSVLQRWNEKYAGAEFVFGQNPNDFLTTQIERFKKGGNLLAVGDGEGRNGVWLAQQGFHVLSVDGAENGVLKAILRAEQEAVQDHFTGLCIDLLDWVWPRDVYDGVVSLYLHFPPDERTIMHQAMYDSLKTGGILLLEAFHPDQIGRETGGPKTPDLCFTSAQLKNDFKQAEILLSQEILKEIQPTPFRKGGIGMVTRMVLRKPSL
jgi:SAM-dependent methyltransferase